MTKEEQIAAAREEAGLPPIGAKAPVMEGGEPLSAVERVRRESLPDPFREAPSDGPPFPPKYNDGNGPKLSDDLMSLGGGFSWGALDEGIAGAGALGLKASNALGLTDKGENVGETYQGIYDDLEEDRNAFKAEHPYRAMGNELAGGLASGSAAYKGIIAALTKMNLRQTPSNFRKVAEVLGIGGIEGLIAGWFGANQDDRVGGAARGGTIGMAVPAALMGAMKLAKVATNRRVEEDLNPPAGSGEPFVPIPQTDGGKGVLQNLYRSVVGNSPFGGREKMMELSQPRLTAASDAVDVGKAALAEAQKKWKWGKGRYEGFLNRHKNREIGVYNTDTDATMRAEALRVNAAQAIEKTAVHDELIEAAIPKSFPPALVAEVKAAPSLAEAFQLIKTGFRDHSFPTLKAVKYKATADSVKASLAQALGTSPAMVKNAEGWEDKVDDLFADYQLMNGEIAGDALMELRNSFASVNAGSGRQDLVKGAHARLVKRLDQLIDSKLTPEQMEGLANDRAVWGNRLLLEGALNKSVVKEQLEPSATSILEAAKQVRGIDTVAGTNLIQKLAYKMQTSAKRASEGVVAFNVRAARDLEDKKTALREHIASRKLLASQRESPKVIKAKEELKALEAHLKEIKDMSPTEHTTFMSQLVAGGFLGAGFGIPHVFTGGKVGHILANKKVQTAIAGQTGTQERVSDILRQNDEKWNMFSAGAGGAAGTQAEYAH